MGPGLREQITRPIGMHLFYSIQKPAANLQDEASFPLSAIRAQVESCP